MYHITAKINDGELQIQRGKYTESRETREENPRIELAARRTEECTISLIMTQEAFLSVSKGRHGTYNQPIDLSLYCLDYKT